jgi:hypothetical protein
LERTIKMFITGTQGTEVKEVTLAEARKVLEHTYADPVGGFVANRKNGEIISEITPDIDEVIIIDHLIGGG